MSNQCKFCSYIYNLSVNQQYQINAMEGFVAKQAQEGMPPYISLLFRARRPIEPLRALH